MTARRVLPLLLALLALAACGKSPTKVFQRLQEAARAGDDEVFASYFSADSKPFAQALLALYDSSYPKEGPAPRPLAQLTLADVQSESVDGDKAEVVVAAKGGPPVTLVFVKEGDGWKLDVRLTDRHARNLPDDE
jgi:hypothetical protein